MSRRVVVTGLGICAPLTFAEVIQGRCGLVPPADWSVPETPLRVGRVPGDPAAAIRALPAPHGGHWRPDRLDPFAHFALLAAHEARVDSGLTEPNAFREAAVIVASAMGGERTHDTSSAHLAEHKHTGRRLRLSPFTAPKLMPNAASACVGMLLGAHGPNISPAGACASGGYALAQAADQIRLGRAEVAVTGAAEAPCEEIAARTFLSGEALSPEGRSLPFHRERNGFVLAEGAAILVLEELEHARRRGARIYGELAGVGLTCDAYHVVAPHPDGTYAAEAMRRALREAGMAPAVVGYVNAHATGTPVGDLAECRALRAVFGKHPPLVSST
ncbi:MAG TPA: beta-ketoacyl-[acyl-carrier-protein] synthase family protein, partial [Longimicrobium sp.]|nr:beta-ketoacyl-[acyl-carrier-protein] synthase family protein [Longimicrobium sp.]